MDAGMFFNRLAILIGSNLPLPDNDLVVAALVRIGLVSGKPLNINRLDPAARQVLEGAVEIA